MKWLPSINKAFIIFIIIIVRNVWLGGKYAAAGNHWEWISSGDDIPAPGTATDENFENWGSDSNEAPPPRGSECLVMYIGPSSINFDYTQWHRYRCNNNRSPLPCICEKPLQ